jgi:hypothetical protein
MNRVNILMVGHKLTRRYTSEHLYKLFKGKELKDELTS